MDPRRVKPLIDLILSAVFEPDSESFFTESKKLAFVNEIFLNFSWRMHPMILEYLRFYHKHLSNSYKSIRDTLGKILCNLINLEWHPSASTVEEVLNNPSLLIPVENPEIRNMMIHMVSELEKYRLDNNLTKYQNLAKTGITF